MKQHNTTMTTTTRQQQQYHNDTTTQQTMMKQQTQQHQQYHNDNKSATNDFSHYFIHEFRQFCLVGVGTKHNLYFFYFSRQLPLIPNVLIRNTPTPSVLCLAHEFARNYFFFLRTSYTIQTYTVG